MTLESVALFAWLMDVKEILWQNFAENAEQNWMNIQAIARIVIVIYRIMLSI